VTKLARARLLGPDIHRSIWEERFMNLFRSWPLWFIRRAAERRVPKP
jgi:hypothetical protein